MAAVREVVLPDIGDFKDVEVIEVLVKPGDEIAVETPLITLESDKATMEVPSPYAGTVQSIRVEVGDRISEGATILALAEKTAVEAAPVADSRAREAPAKSSPAATPQPAVPAPPAEQRPPAAAPAPTVPAAAAEQRPPAAAPAPTVPTAPAE
ncbi:MAG: biotin/lipoyl-containing protein, partial [Gammaproteobacteria bacterium]